jgi:hypothetical protein
MEDDKHKPYDGVPPQHRTYKPLDVPFGPLDGLLKTGRDLHGALVRVSNGDDTYLLLRYGKSETGYTLNSLDGTRGRELLKQFVKNLRVIGIQTNPELKR